jgi:hypothetical protein
MYKIVLFVTLLGLASFSLGQTNGLNSPHIKFINALEGQTITVVTDLAGTFELEYTQANNYSYVAGGSLQVSVTGNTTGNLFNTTVLVTFDYYCTIAVVSKNGTFLLVPYNESVPSSFINNFVNASNSSDNAPNRAWVRFLNLGSSSQVSLYPTSSSNTPLFQHVGFLQISPYVEVDPSTAQFLTLQESTSTTITVPTTLQNSTAYTIAAFSPSTGFLSALYYDRFVPFENATQQLTTGVVVSNTSSSTSSSNSTLTGIQSTTSVATGAQLTTGNQATAVGSTSTGSTSSPAHNSADKVTVFAAFTAIVTLLVL